MVDTQTLAKFLVQHKENALTKSVELKELEIFKILVKLPQFDDTVNLAFKESAKHGYTDIVKLLLKDHRVDPSAQDNLAICLASENGNTEVVRLLLKDERVDKEQGSGSANAYKASPDSTRSVCPSARDNYAIRMASGNGHAEIVELLLKDSRVDPSARDNRAIRWASYNGNTEVVRLLLKHHKGVFTTTGGLWGPLIKACERGHTDIVKLLLEDGREDPTLYNNCAIREACYNGHTEVVKLLLEDGRVDPSVEDNGPLRSAEQFGHTEIAKLLKSYTKNPKQDVNILAENILLKTQLEVLKKDIENRESLIAKLIDDNCKLQAELSQH